MTQSDCVLLIWNSVKMDNQVPAETKQPQKEQCKSQLCKERANELDPGIGKYAFVHVQCEINRTGCQ